MSNEELSAEEIASQFIKAIAKPPFDAETQSSAVAMLEAFQLRGALRGEARGRKAEREEIIDYLFQARAAAEALQKASGHNLSYAVDAYTGIIKWVSGRKD